MAGCRPRVANAPIASRVRTDAERAARADAAAHGEIDQVIVRDPTNTVHQITVRVRSLMKDGSERCYEWRADLNGDNGKLWPVPCP